VRRSATSSALSSVVSSSASSLIFALLPKCPACLVFLLAPFGIRLPGSRWFLAYVLVLTMAIPLLFFATPGCRKSCGVRPMLLAIAGLLTMALGRVYADSTTLVILGAMAMFAAAFWTARSLAASRSSDACSARTKAVPRCAS